MRAVEACGAGSTAWESQLRLCAALKSPSNAQSWPLSAPPTPVLLCRLHIHYAVLGVSGMLEGYSLYVAVKSIRAGAAARKMGFVHYVKRYD